MRSLLCAALLALLAVQPAPSGSVPALQPYADSALGFRILRPASWKVHRAQDMGMVIFYRAEPFQPPRFLVLPDLPVAGRLTPEQAARVVLVELLGLGRHPGLRWEVGEAGRGSARWAQGGRATRMLFWIRTRPGPPGTTRVAFLGGAASEAERVQMFAVYERMRRSYAGPW